MGIFGAVYCGTVHCGIVPLNVGYCLPLHVPPLVLGTMGLHVCSETLGTVYLYLPWYGVAWDYVPNIWLLRSYFYLPWHFSVGTSVQ